MRKLETRDIFSFIRLIKEVNLKEEFKKIASMSTNATAEEVGFDMLFIIFDKLAEENSEQKLYEFLSGPFEMEAEEVAQLELFDLLEGLQACADWSKWKAFLKSASRLI